MKVNDSTRRILLFIVIVVVGSVLVLFDIPAVLMVIGIIALAVLVLLINGSIHIPKPSFPKFAKKPKKDKSALASTKASAQAKGKPQTATGVSPKPAKTKTGGKPGMFGSLTDALSSMSNAFSVLAGDIGKAGKSGAAKQRERQRLDKMLDQSVQGKPSDIRSLKEANHEILPTSKKSVDDPFSTLVKEDMNTELLDSSMGDNPGDISLLNDIDFGSEMNDLSGSFGDDIANLDIALDQDDGAIELDDDSADDEVASILNAHKDDLEGDSDKDAADDMGLSGLEDLDIGNIDLDSELDLPEEARDKPTPEPVKEKASPSAKGPAFSIGGSPGSSSKPPEAEKPKEMGDSMISFSTGKGMDDDLMSSLKSDATNVKRDNNAPLLRELKDVKVPAEDLEKELSGLLTISKPKK